jgi:F-type H+-transporting ATPase subunit O
MATQAAASKLVRPPLALFGTEGRYTNALYSAASKENKLDAVEADLKKLSVVVKEDIKFRDYLLNPSINLNQKKKVLEEVLTSKLGACQVTVNLVNVMAENRRLSILGGVARMYLQVMRATRGEVVCTVTTAKPVTEDSMKKELEAALKGFTKNKIEITMRVDPTIIGGMVIDFGGEHYIDMSMRSKLKLYSDLIKQPV